MGSWSGQTEHITKESGFSIELMEKENSFMQLAIFMKVNGTEIKPVAKVHI